MAGGNRKSGSPNDDLKIAKEAILKLARALARQAARADHGKAQRDWRKKPRKHLLKPSRK